MIQYIVECMAFQLLFLMVYDLFLKRETFFKWNRLYLLVSFALSLMLPFIQLEAFKSTIPQNAINPASFLVVLEEVTVVGTNNTSVLGAVSWVYWLLILGSLVTSRLFVLKLYKLKSLKNRNTITAFNTHNEIVLKNSYTAFSFFKDVYLGDQLKSDKRAAILEHELVHLKQWHSIDLLFFELMRVLFWFNPLVYLYQKRITEIHEFLADAQTVKTDKKRQYQLLLSEVFNTEDISFVNQFFKTSLIKKRINMIQKQKSKTVNQCKYLLLLPLIVVMLVYSSCEEETKVVETEVDLVNKIKGLQEELAAKEALSEDEQKALSEMINESFPNVAYGVLAKKALDSKSITDLLVNDPEFRVPFSVMDQVPVFPGCENETDKKACFNNNINRHIRKHFRYPEAAQEQGIQGRVSVMFIIKKDGSIGDVRMRGPDASLEQEAARIIGRLPKMVSGKHNGEAVNVSFAIPISFKLQ